MLKKMWKFLAWLQNLWGRWQYWNLECIWLVFGFSLWHWLCKRRVAWSHNPRTCGIGKCCLKTLLGLVWPIKSQEYQWHVGTLTCGFQWLLLGLWPIQKIDSRLMACLSWRATKWWQWMAPYVKVKTWRKSQSWWKSRRVVASGQRGQRAGARWLATW